MIDYRDLLKKYIRHVGQSEGSTFLGDQNVRRSDQWDQLTPGEQEELERLDREAGEAEGWWPSIPLVRRTDR